MAHHMGRYPVAQPLTLAEGWSAERLLPPSRVFGANGLRTGPDGRVYIAQVTGSTISALDVASGELTTISGKGGDIIAPDDIAFDPHGNLYATEVMDGRVSVREASGRARVLRDDIPCANGITFHRGRLFVGECRIGGRIMELDLNGGAPRVLVDNVPMPNAMEVGPDGFLYFPVMGTNEIWRVHPDGGAHQRVAGELGVPDAVKFDARGSIVSTQVHTGEVLRVDPRDGSRTRLAALDPGLDNLTFAGERLFVSNINGAITEVLDGQTKTVLPCSLNWPLDLTVSDDGQVYVADGATFYVVSGGAPRPVAMLMTPGYPGFVRGLTSIGDGTFMVTTSGGNVSRYKPATNESEVLAQGLDQVYGLAVAAGGEAVVAEFGTGRVLSIRAGRVDVLASGLRDPIGVAIAADGSRFVTEAGRVVRLTGSGVETVLDGLQRPQGILARDELLYIVDAGAKTLLVFDRQSRQTRIIASDLPVGAPPGVTPKPLRGFQPFSGPQGPFAGIAAGADGTLYVSADGEGSVLALRQRGRA
jgi:sugar lactone lactonase YvrE